MQVRAIMDASQKAAAEGIDVQLGVMVPQVSHANEMRRLREILEESIDPSQSGAATRIEYKIGAMIEVPRAALTADEIAETAEFFSCGTNDLTQTTFAMSRDDAERKFLLRYVEDEILPDNPFQAVDRSGVGRLVQIACELGRKARPGMAIGVCGGHGGDPSSIQLFHEIGIDYVSCSPHRVPVARLAAAQAAVRDTAEDA
jgi:pyruvate,orthophosphate dikinase